MSINIEQDYDDIDWDDWVTTWDKEISGKQRARTLEDLYQAIEDRLLKKIAELTNPMGVDCPECGMAQLPGRTGCKCKKEE